MPELAAHAHVLPLRKWLEVEPWRVDWFNALRWFEAKNPHKPRLGMATRPSDEVLRVTQPPSLQFAPASLVGFDHDKHGHPRLAQLGFGLFGPNGPLPLHITEFARSVASVDKDEGLQAFVDIFQHRAALLFYRAWASAQATTSLDRPDDDSFGRYLGSLAGYGEAANAGHDSVPDHARRHMSGHLVRLTRNPEGLTAILASFFGWPFRVEEWVMNWLTLMPEDRSELGGHGDASRLGVGAVCGEAVPDRLHRFRIHAGPLDLAAYERFLPDGAWHRPLRDWVRHYTGFELAWDTRLILRAGEVPATRLGGETRLGWTSWLEMGARDRDAGDLILDCEGLDAHAQHRSETMRSS